MPRRCFTGLNCCRGGRRDILWNSVVSWDTQASCVRFYCVPEERGSEVQSHGFQSIPLHEHSVRPPCVCLQVLVCLSCPLCLVHACLCCVSCRSEAGRASGWEPMCKGRGVATRWSLSSMKERERDPREKKVDTFPRWCGGGSTGCPSAKPLVLPTHPCLTPTSWPHSEALSL